MRANAVIFKMTCALVIRGTSLLVETLMSTEPRPNNGIQRTHTQRASHRQWLMSAAAAGRHAASGCGLGWLKP
jgi:hypothetical protein